MPRSTQTQPCSLYLCSTIKEYILTKAHPSPLTAPLLTLLLKNRPTTTLRLPSANELHPRTQSCRRTNERGRGSLKDQAERKQTREIQAIRPRRCCETGAGRYLGRSERDGWTWLNVACLSSFCACIRWSWNYTTVCARGFP